MTLFGFRIQRLSALRVVRGAEPLTEKEMEGVFATHSEAHPVFRAVLQLLETAEDNANRAAAQDKQDRDKHVGHAECCRLLRDDIFIRLENGIRNRGKLNQESRKAGKELS